MGQTIHMCMSVRGALRKTGRDFNQLARACTDNQGRQMTPAAVRDWLLDELSKGREVIPFDKPCEGFDYVTGCPGHEEPSPRDEHADHNADGHAHDAGADDPPDPKA